ncbi:MAG: hypothetical protein IT307_00015 [Chloroflexi bacterium]|nr:hypothetical protein [Chloroflexota bacterium]
MGSERLLRRAAERAAQGEVYLASLLLPYAQCEGLDGDGLATRLGCAPSALPRLLLCRRPRGETARFRQDVERIATARELDSEALANVIRVAEALHALHQAQPDRQTGGWLAAARDWEAEDE